MRNYLWFIVLVFAVFCGNAIGAEETYYKTIKLDGVENCVAASGKNGTKKLESRAVKVELPPGQYSFECISGGISKWPDEATAHSQKREPWLCFGQVSAKGVIAIIGRDWGYKTPEIAIEKNRDNQAEINLDEKTTVYVWIEDAWKGVDYCDDNRGVLNIGIKKQK